jgi:hypothetical protein
MNRSALRSERVQRHSWQRVLLTPTPLHTRIVGTNVGEGGIALDWDGRPIPWIRQRGIAAAAYSANTSGSVSLAAPASSWAPPLS